MATSKHPRHGQRTQADEVEFDASLRRASAVVREVNGHLREALKCALENNAVLAEALAQLSEQHGVAMKQLAVYRRTFAENSAKATQMAGTVWMHRARRSRLRND